MERALASTRPKALTLALALLLLAFAFQGSRGLLRPDEGRYTAVALRMLENGDWMHPELNHEAPHYTKPPLTYWAVAGTLEIFGRSEWAARLPADLAYLGTTLLVLLIARRLGSPRPWLAGAIHATMFLPVLASGAVTTDPLLTLFETVGVLGFVLRAFGSPRRPIAANLCLGLGFGAALLTKGPPGLLPLLAILAFTFFAQGARGLRRSLPVSAAALMLGVGLWWYLVVFMQRPGLLQQMVSHEVVGRLIDPSLKRNPEWYGALKIYAPVLLLGTLPWTPCLLRWIPKLPRTLNSAWWCSLRERDPQSLFLLVWILLPLSVFALSRSRLPLYLLPTFVPLALLVERSSRATLSFTRLRLAALGCWVALLLAIRIALGIYPLPTDARPMALAVAQASARPIREIVFVDEKPNWGLSFYTGAEVEACAATEVFARAHPEIEPLEAELREPEEPRLWAMCPDSPASEAFQTEVESLGRRACEVTRSEGLAFYAVVPGLQGP